MVMGAWGTKGTGQGSLVPQKRKKNHNMSYCSYDNIWISSLQFPSSFSASSSSAKDRTGLQTLSFPSPANSVSRVFPLDSFSYPSPSVSLRFLSQFSRQSEAI